MKAADAIELLKHLSPSHEVTLIIGDSALVKRRDFNPPPLREHIPTYWVPQGIPRKNEVTCVGYRH